MIFHLYCKSYRGDLQRAKFLAESVQKHNVDKLPFVVSVPRVDVGIFKDALGDLATIIEDESIFGAPQMEGWVYQQIVKSLYWRESKCDAYLLLDSDCYFIRPFTKSDFVHPSGVPYTVMHEQHDMFNWTCNKSKVLGFDPQKSFGECRTKIMDLFERKGRLYDFGPVPVIWSTAVWKSFCVDYLFPNGLSMADVIQEVPSEFTWYGEFLLTSKTIPIWPVEPLFKVFHYRQQYEEAKNNGYTESDLSKVYSGIVMQSNWGAPLRY